MVLGSNTVSSRDIDNIVSTREDHQRDLMASAFAGFLAKMGKLTVMKISAMCGVTGN